MQPPKRCRLLPNYLSLIVLRPLTMLLRFNHAFLSESQITWREKLATTTI